MSGGVGGEKPRGFPLSRLWYARKHARPEPSPSPCGSSPSARRSSGLGRRQQIGNKEHCVSCTSFWRLRITQFSPFTLGFGPVLNGATTLSMFRFFDCLRYTPHMSTDRRSLTSPINGRKSKGPKTPEGKAASIRQGILSRNIVLDDESSERFNALASEFHLRTPVHPHPPALRHPPRPRQCGFTV